MFEEERLEQVIKDNRNNSAESIKSAILTTLNRYCNGTVQDDDVTLIVAKALKA